MNKNTVVCYSLVKSDLKRGVNRRTQTNISQHDGNVIQNQASLTFHTSLEITVILQITWNVCLAHRNE